jgi:putative membrane-bound dehydrogenase-like protein
MARRYVIFAVVMATVAGCLIARSLTRPPTPASGGTAPQPGSSDVLSTIRVPAGFTVERVAAPPLIEHPMMAGFDDRGRLYVADTEPLNLPAVERAKRLPGSIRMLEDTDGDGRFDKTTLFADKLAFPMGALWHDGAVYTCSPPSLWKLEDTDGDGVADKRQELVGTFGSSGNAADIHGPFLSPDGRLYWCDGRHGHEIPRPDGTVMKGNAARIFRCKPDGSELEVVCGGGMDNPVEIVFTDEGEPLASVNLVQARPQRIDGIFYAIEGGAYPWNEVVSEFKRTGELLPIVGDLGWVAVSGLERYRGTSFGKEFRGNLFSAQFNPHRVQRHVIERAGAAFKISNEDFLTSSGPDFHPTDVLEDADGSLLVIDTGGWFRIGCPVSQVAKPDIRGAIYRVRKNDAPKVEDPRGVKLKWEGVDGHELLKRVSDTRPAVAQRSLAALARLGNDAVPILEGHALGKDATALHAVWALARLDTAAARDAMRAGILNQHGPVRQAAARSVGLARHGRAFKELIDALPDERPQVAAEVATALGRIRAQRAVPNLLSRLRGEHDRFLQHAIIYALIQINDSGGTRQGLADADPLVRRGALIAMDQMDAGQLTPELVSPLLAAEDRALRQTAIDVATSRGWAGEVSLLLRRWLAASQQDAGRLDAIRAGVLAFAKEESVQQLVTDALEQEPTPERVRLLLLDAMAQAPLEKLPPAWAEALTTALAHPAEPVARQAVATAAAVASRDFDPPLLRLAGDASRPAELRAAALAAAAPRLPKLDTDQFSLLKSELQEGHPPLRRMTAARALGAAKLNALALLDLATEVESAGAMELSHLLPAYERSNDPAVGEKLLAALEKSPGLPSLSPDLLRRTFKGYPAAVQQAAAPLLKRIEPDVAGQKARLAELQPALAGGDAARGRNVFFGGKAACSTCHAIAGEGRHVGPDLGKIGSVRTPADLLESIVFPNASFAREFEPYTVVTKEGDVHVGIIVRETPDSLHLRTPDDLRLPRSGIKKIEPSKVSVMPQGLEAQLARQELADLIAFLMSLK